LRQDGRLGERHLRQPGVILAVDHQRRGVVKLRPFAKQRCGAALQRAHLRGRQFSCEPLTQEIMEQRVAEIVTV